MICGSLVDNIVKFFNDQRKKAIDSNNFTYHIHTNESMRTIMMIFRTINWRKASPNTQYVKTRKINDKVEYIVELPICRFPQEDK